MTRRDRLRRAALLAFWRVLNPLGRRLAGIGPWWVVLETTGRRSGLPRQVPLARGPVDGRTAWLVAVHGAHSAFVRNIAVRPRVRLRMGGRWHEGTAALVPLDPDVLRRFNAYARLGPRLFGIAPALVRVDLD